MNITEAMNKAVEGGYHVDGSDGTQTYYNSANSEYSVWTRTDNQSSFMIPVEETFLDPKFWQALGRALGWDYSCHVCITCFRAGEECCTAHGYYWMYQWHCFIQAIANGKTTEAFFARFPSAVNVYTRTHSEQEATIE